MPKGMGAYEAMSQAPTMKTPKAPKKELSHIELREGESGGHVATHHFTSYEHKPEDHVFGESEGGKLMAHLKSELHIGEGEE